MTINLPKDISLSRKMIQKKRIFIDRCKGIRMGPKC